MLPYSSAGRIKVRYAVNLTSREANFSLRLSDQSLTSAALHRLVICFFQDKSLDIVMPKY